MSKKESKVFHKGKGIKTDERTVPLKGAPNTNYDTYRKKDGKLKSRKKYGADGFAYTDYNTSHPTHNQFDHAHDYSNGERSKARNLTQKEKREFEKAKRKRRFW